VSAARVDLSGVVVEVGPLDEWTQIYHEGWRHMRDFYWDPGLGGVNWNAVRDQYATLLPLAEMIGELSTSHTYVFGGDFGTQVPQHPTGLLGADVEVDGGILTQPSAAWWDPQRGWDLENHGVDPDIVVDNLPQDLARGIDAQLDRGISEVLRLHAEHPPLEPRFGPARPRGRDAFRQELARRPGRSGAEGAASGEGSAVGQSP
jgi:hypothetical protein